jgi:hypothetical protein
MNADLLVLLAAAVGGLTLGIGLMVGLAVVKAIGRRLAENGSDTTKRPE